MQQITGINHIGLRVAELARTRVFYEKLGFDFLVGPIGPEPVAIMEHPSGVNINFILNAATQGNILMDVAEKHPGYTHVSLNVTDLDAVIAQLYELGISLSGTLDMEMGKAVFIRDPDLNVVEFHQSLKPFNR
jgi:lactoylglutathione lyase